MGLNRCIANTRNGSRCGRIAPPGEQFCSKHDPTKPQAGIAQTVPKTPEEILRHLMADRDPGIRLRAVDAWLKYEERQKNGCPSCEMQAEADRQRKSIVAALTEDERAQAESLLAGLRALKEQVWLREPHLRPLSVAPPPPPHEEQDAPAIVVSLQEPDTPKEEAPTQPVPEPYRLPEDQWSAVGLFKMNNVVTHCLGDAHAEQILDGTIPIEEARADEERAERERKQILNSYRRL